MSTNPRSYWPDICPHSTAELQLALLARRDEELRRLIQAAGTRASDVRRQIRRAAEMRPVRIQGPRGARVHLVAMPVLLDFGSASAIGPAEVRLFTPGTPMASRADKLWKWALGAQAESVVALPQAIRVEAILGVSPTDVHEFAFFGASLIEGTRKQPARLKLADPYARAAGNGLVAPYLLMALATCTHDLELEEAPWRRARFEFEQHVRAMFSTPRESPQVRSLRPRRLFDAIDSAQAAQLVYASDWVAGHGGTQRLDKRKLANGRIEIQCSYEFPGKHGASKMRWAYDSTWRDLPDRWTAQVQIDRGDDPH